MRQRHAGFLHPSRVLALITLVALVAGASAATAVYLVTTKAPQPGSGFSPINDTLSFSSVTSNQAGGNFWYNTSVVGAKGSFNYNDFTIMVSTVSGSSVQPGSSWSLGVYPANGSKTPLTTLNFSSGSTPVWATGSPVTISTGQLISLYSGTMSLSGYELRIIANGSSLVTGQIVLPLS